MISHCKRNASGITFAAIAALSCAASEGKSAAPQAGQFQIRNVKHGLLLRPEDAKKSDGTPMLLYPAQNWKCLVWKFDPATGNGFHLQNLFTGKTFAGRPGLKDSATTAVVQVSQPAAGTSGPAWQFLKESDGYYRIVDQSSGEALTAQNSPSNDPQIVLMPWTSTPEQKWEILAAPDHLDM